MSHAQKKTPLIFCFFLCHMSSHHHHRVIGSSGHRVFGSSTEGGIREWAISAAHVASLVVVVDAGVAHQRESAGEARVSREVRAVIKSGITRDAQAVFVFVEFLHALFLRKFEPGFVGLRRLNSRRRRHAGGSSSSSPVAGSNMLGHRSSCLSLSQVAIIWPIDEKAFQFYSADSVNRRIMIKIGKWGVVTCHRKKIHTPLCVLSHVTHTHTITFTYREPLCEAPTSS